MTLAAAATLVVVASATPSAASNWTNASLSRGTQCLEIENSSQDNGARAQGWGCSGQQGAKWAFIWNGSNGGSSEWFWIVNSSGKCLEIADSRMDNGAPAQQWQCTQGVDTQLWRTITFPDGGEYLQNKNSGKVLEIENSSFGNGARAQQWSMAGVSGQSWNIQTWGGA
ncbi:RICIN domain-containing protein [Streptomyces sp. MMG1121]|uniref:RICIN domain-containing protein n=1 Tax=Streptomyces sp. MMG1121 TaxID=1415544 RepID=UPI0006AFF5F8|nr:RICIN domain-containing protein [Streptomyces sp. MMG1121]